MHFVCLFDSVDSEENLLYIFIKNFVGNRQRLK